MAQTIAVERIPTIGCFRSKTTPLIAARHYHKSQGNGSDAAVMAVMLVMLKDSFPAPYLRGSSKDPANQILRKLHSN